MRFPLDVGEQIASIMGIGTQLGGSCVRSTLERMWRGLRDVTRCQPAFSPPTRRRVDVTLAGTVEGLAIPPQRSSGSFRERRHLSAGQRAMAVAILYPDPEKGGRR
jgi:hypothetical protein